MTAENAQQRARRTTRLVAEMGHFGTVEVMNSNAAVASLAGLCTLVGTWTIQEAAQFLLFTFQALPDISPCILSELPTTGEFVGYDIWQEFFLEADLTLLCPSRVMCEIKSRLGFVFQNQARALLSFAHCSEKDGSVINSCCHLFGLVYRQKDPRPPANMM